MKIWKALFGPKTEKQSDQGEDKKYNAETNQEGTFAPPNSLFGRTGNRRYINPKDMSNSASPFSPNKRDRF